MEYKLVIMKNTKKEEGSKQPDWRIKFVKNNTFIDAGALWEKLDRNSNIYLTGSFDPEKQPFKKAVENQTVNNKPSLLDDIDDSVPF